MKHELSFLFDVDDTLYNQLDPFQLAYEKNFGHAKKQVSVEKLYKQSRVFSDKVFAKTERGEMSVQDMRIYRITNAFKSLDVPISDKQGMAFEQDYSYFLQHIQLEPAMREVLKLCREQGFKLGVITNGALDRQHAKLQRLGVERWIPRENWFISGKVKLLKPDPRLFRYVEARMHILPKNTYYIGDSFSNDIVGAKGAGWHAVWLNQRQRLSGNQKFHPDATLNSLDELLPAIHKIIQSREA